MERLQAKDKTEAEERRREVETAEPETEGDEESGMTEDEKSAALIDRAFGKPPEDLDFTPYEAHLKDTEDVAGGQN